LVRSLVWIQEAERRRLARELHDQMGQHLVALGLGLDRLAQMIEAPEAHELVEWLRQLSNEMSRDIHDLALELRPPALDDLGLASAIRSHGERLAAQAGFTIDVHCRVEGLDATVETTIYRVVQEALTNVARHAGASQVSVVVDQPDDSIRVAIEDDGNGRCPDPSRTAPACLGIAGMRERAAMIGGILEIESSPGHGTTVFLRVPVTRHEKQP
jgi:signal transduction histidine kinase